MKNLGRLLTFVLLTVALGWPQSQINQFQILRLGQQTATPASPPANSALIYFNSAGTAVCIKSDGSSCFSSAGGTVTSIATTTPITGGTITTTGTIACPTCAIGPGSSTTNHLVKFSGTDGLTLADGGAVPTGTVTSIATTSPIAGGTITGTGTLTCTTCVVASSPGVGLAHFAGSTQTVTSSLIVAADITSGTITGTQLSSSTALPNGVTATTQALADNSTKVATTAFVLANAGSVTTEAHTASSSATLDFTTCITGSHTVYRFDISEIIPATNQVDIQALVSTDGGSTFSSTTYSEQFFEGVGGSTRADNFTGSTRFQLDDPNDSGVVNTANIGVSGTLTFNNPGGANFKEVTGLIYYERGFDGLTAVLSIGGSWKTTTAINAIRFKASSGNLASGTITCTPIV